jgi:hypothetical protein
MINRKRILPLVGLVAVFLCGMAADDKAPPAPAEKIEKQEIEKLIKQLGSDDFDEREKATQKLAACDDALPQLREAAKSPDLEAQQRAEKLVRQIVHRQEERALQEMAADVNKGGIDRFIDLMATRKDYATPERFELAYKLAKAMAARASKVGGKESAAPELDLSRMKTLTTCPRTGPVGSKVILDGGAGDMTVAQNSLLISADSLKGHITSVSHCVLFINGDTKGFTGLDDSVVFCNGDVGWITGVNKSVIIVTGTFKGSTTAADCFFHTTEFGRHTGSRNNVYVNMTQVTATSQEGNRFVQTDDGPLQMFKMFDASYFGVEMGKGEDGLKVKAVRDGTPFAKAGFEKGDLLVGSDNGPIASAEEFRRFLRRQGAGDTATFKVQRGDKVVELKVEFTD